MTRFVSISHSEFHAGILNLYAEWKMKFTKYLVVQHDCTVLDQSGICKYIITDGTTWKKRHLLNSHLQQAYLMTNLPEYKLLYTYFSTRNQSLLQTGCLKKITDITVQ